MSKLTHIDEHGKANMVDVADKAITKRSATATGFIAMNQAALDAVKDQNNKKGDVLSVARVAGIMAAKQTANLIPLCHPLALSKVQIDFEQNENGIRVFSLAKCEGKTGVEMEALTGANVALLTLFDMCKALDPEMLISDVKVNTKTGGKTGDWARS